MREETRLYRADGPFLGTVKGSGLSAGVAAVPEGSRVLRDRKTLGVEDAICRSDPCGLKVVNTKGGYYVDLLSEAS